MAGSDIQAAGSRSSPWRHAPEYLIEAVGLGIFLWAAVGLTVLLEHPDSALRAAVPDPFVRRGCMGIAMGATAVALVYSPWGKRSGAHFNPALTFAFFRLGRIAPVDALCYALAQFAGALAGIAAAGLVFGPLPSDQAVRFAATLPGAAGPASAFAAELAISFGLMLLVLVASNSPRLAPYTGILCGLLIATYITLEAPISGMSMNPARTLGSAAGAGVFSSLWIYFAAPTLGMLLAAQAYVGLGSRRRVRCAKLHHRNEQRCIFRCGYAER